LRRLRSENQFSIIFKEVNEMIDVHDLEPVVVPRVRRPPQRYCIKGAVYVAATPEEHYRVAYYAVIDVAIVQLMERFNKESAGLQTYLKLEAMLLSGEVDQDICKQYRELNPGSLSSQLTMFSQQNEYSSLQQAQTVMQNMIPEVRGLFPQVERLLRLLLVCPATSCTTERSFSALRRLKTWLRTTMTQQRLNAVAVCHVHQEILDSLDIMKLAEEFASRSDIRRGLFGNWV
jgi:hAT family C-terminal dimerisation region